MSDDPLTMRDLAGLEFVAGLVDRGARLRRVDPNDEDRVLEGIARCFSGFAGEGRAVDIRDQYLRVTSKSGTEMFWPVRELMSDVHAGRIAEGWRNE